MTGFNKEDINSQICNLMEECVGKIDGIVNKLLESFPCPEDEESDEIMDAAYSALSMRNKIRRTMVKEYDFKSFDAEPLKGLYVYGELKKREGHKPVFIVHAHIVFHPIDENTLLNW
jgi:hypothetical protein